LGGAAMHTPNRHLSFLFSFFIIWLGHIVENFWAETFGKKKNSNFVKTSQWFGHQCWTELRRTSYCLGQIAKILVAGSQRQENLITSMGSLYVHGT